MAPASRMPEGDESRCPVCGAAVRLEPASPLRDGPCPNCGALLWFPAREPESASHEVLALLQMRLGSVPTELSEAVRDRLEQTDRNELLEQAFQATSWEAFLAADLGS